MWVCRNVINHPKFWWIIWIIPPIKMVMNGGWFIIAIITNNTQETSMSLGFGYLGYSFHQWHYAPMIELLDLGSSAPMFGKKHLQKFWQSHGKTQRNPQALQWQIFFTLKMSHLRHRCLKMLEQETTMCGVCFSYTIDCDCDCHSHSHITCGNTDVDR